MTDRELRRRIRAAVRDAARRIIRERTAVTRILRDLEAAFAREGRRVRTELLAPAPRKRARRRRRA